MSEDERAVGMLIAGIAIDNARRYSVTEARRDELEQVVHALRATVEIPQRSGAKPIGREWRTSAKRGRALISARTQNLECGMRDWRSSPCSRRGEVGAVPASGGRGAELPRAERSGTDSMKAFSKADSVVRWSGADGKALISRR